MKKFDHFKSNLKILEKADKEDLTTEFILGGITDKFFIQFELGWKVLKELLTYEGQAVAASGSPRMILKAAFTIYDFLEEELWLNMLKARNDMTHIYDFSAAKRMVEIILKDYIPAFQRMKEEIEDIYGNELDKM